MKPGPKPAAVEAASVAVVAEDMGVVVEAGVAAIAAVEVAAAAVAAASANTRIVQNKKTQAPLASLVLDLRVLDISLLHTNSIFGLCGMMPAL